MQKTCIEGEEELQTTPRKEKEGIRYTGSVQDYQGYIRLVPGDVHS